MPVVGIASVIWSVAGWIAKLMGLGTAKWLLILTGVAAPIALMFTPILNNVLAPITVWMVGGIVKLFIWFCIWAVELLPSVPDIPNWYYTSTISNTFSAVNRYLPLAEGAQLYATYLSIYTALSVVKLVKFIKG